MQNNHKEAMIELAKQQLEYDDYIRQYPLAQYSTTQLKAELRRRKKEK